jgi:TonB family protein
MRFNLNDAQRRRAGALISIALHASLLAVSVGIAIRARERISPLPAEQFVAVARVAVSGGSHAVKVPLPEDPAAAHTRHPVENANPVKKTLRPPMPNPRPVRSGGGAPAAPHNGDGSGQAARGNGTDSYDAQPAFPVFSPSPKVSDRGLLPKIEQRVVVDVRVDELGGVVGETLVKGLGTVLDQIVLDTVKQWRFQPATVNGKPVPTEAELIFPFDQRYPISAS